MSPCQSKGCRLCRLAAIESPHGNRLPSAGFHCVTRMPSNRNSPLSVPIQRYPSLVCVIALTAPPGNLLSVFQYSRTYWSRERFGSSPYARLTRHISAIPFSAQRPCLNQEITEDTRTFRSRLRFPSSTALGPYQVHIRICTYKDMRTDLLPAVGIPKVNTCCFSEVAIKVWIGGIRILTSGIPSRRA